jgi:tRNA threonylcarbamoyladenosine biosynthesis protein TsaE
VVEVNTLQELAIYAQGLAKQLSPGMVVGLRGPLGAGKTALVAALVHALGDRDSVVTSPTYTYVSSYQCGVMQVHHFDWYRLEDLQNLERIGWRDYLCQDALVLVEWPDKIPELAAIFSLMIRIEFLDGGRRAITAETIQKGTHTF